MKIFFKAALCILILVALTSTISPALAAPAPAPIAAPSATFTLLTPLPTQIRVGETYTIDIQVESSEPFTRAAVMAAPYYPAYISSQGGDKVVHGTSTVLHLKLIGRRSTANLPNGVTLVEVVAGTTYQGGQRVVQSYSFDVAVVE